MTALVVVVGAADAAAVAAAVAAGKHANVLLEERGSSAGVSDVSTFIGAVSPSSSFIVKDELEGI